MDAPSERVGVVHFVYFFEKKDGIDLTSVFTLRLNHPCLDLELFVFSVVTNCEILLPKKTLNGYISLILTKLLEYFMVDW